MNENESCGTPPILTPAAGNPCQECPFRKSNAGREHPHDFYRTDQFTSEWRQVAAGDFFACHVTAPDLHPYDVASKAAGYVTPVETGKRPECAGSALAIQRELDLAANYPTYGAYKAARPAGLSPRAFAHLAQRIKGTAAPAFNVPKRFNMDNIKDPTEEIDTTSPIWVFGGSATDDILKTADALLGPAECTCPVCADHADVHSMAVITTAEGHRARVDALLVPLLTAMNRVGIRTTDSCQNLQEAVTALWPERLPELAEHQPGTVTYAQIIESGNAFIRLRTTNEAERQFMQAARHIGVWQSAGDVAQLSFPLKKLPSLLRLAAETKTLTAKEAAS